ncbi:hypothetical protein ABH313_07710 [Chromobacterium vaccinii]|uniref:hypothetical protein n=1 Tax=Chromobacterium vaccinii TaxID=1108595 RepID=UPI003260DBB7
MRLHNRVQLALALLLLAGLCSPLLSHAPNRLLSGQGLRLPALPGAFWLIVPALPLLLSPWLRPSRRLRGLLALCAVLLANGLLLLAGVEAARLGGGDPDSLARTAFGAGFWLLQLAACLQLAESLRGLALSRANTITIRTCSAKRCCAICNWWGYRCCRPRCWAPRWASPRFAGRGSRPGCFRR